MSSSAMSGPEAMRGELEVGEAKPLDFDSVCVREAAYRLGIETEARFVANAPRGGERARGGPWLVIRIGPTAWYYRAGVLRAESEAPGELGDHLNGRSRLIMRDKAATKRALAAAGLPVPQGRLFSRDEAYAAMAYAASLGRVLCVKPNTGAKGRLVFPACHSVAAVAEAFERVAAHFDEVLVEESIPGDIFRYFYVAPRVVGVKLSRPASVVGDGRLTIEALIARKNDERAARGLPGHFPLTIDLDLHMTIAQQGFELATVPPAGRRVTLRSNSNVSAGADTIECVDVVHPSYAREVEAACRAIPGARIVAAEVKILDCRQPAAPRNHRFIEVNSAPALVQFHHPWEGRPQDVAGAVVAYLRDEALTVLSRLPSK
jgi:cyanophycin synthetase